MKLFALMALATLSLPAFAQICNVDMVDSRSRVIKVYSAYGDEHCQEGMKQCRKAIRFEPQLGGADCIPQARYQPAPQQPIPQPIPYPQQPQQPQQPYPQQPQQPQQPYPQQPQRIPEEVLRMNEVDQAINYTLQDCYVVPKVSGWANQLYVRGQFVGNYQVGQQDMELRRTLRDYQARGQCQLKHPALLEIQFRPRLIEEAIDQSLSRNCYVLPRVSGWSNQLFVNGQFSNNFDVNIQNDQVKLRSTLASLLDSGTCQFRTYEERSLLQNPYLIDDFANFQYRGCHVKLNVSGNHQLYVANQFRGNFDRISELTKLKAALVNLVINGTCRFDPM